MEERENECSDMSELTSFFAIFGLSGFRRKDKDLSIHHWKFFSSEEMPHEHLTEAIKLVVLEKSEFQT